MGEGRALGITRGAAGELNIDGIIGAQGGREGGEPSALPCPTQGANRGEVQHARRRPLAEANDDFKLGKRCALERPRRAVRELRRERFQHAEVVAGLKALGGDDGLTANLGESVLKFMDPIGRIDAHHDGADLCRRELGQAPLSAIRRPDADAVSRGQAQG